MKGRHKYYLKNAGPDGGLWFTEEGSLQEGSDRTGVGVNLRHVSPAAHEWRYLS